MASQHPERPVLAVTCLPGVPPEVAHKMVLLLVWLNLLIVPNLWGWNISHVFSPLRFSASSQWSGALVSPFYWKTCLSSISRVNHWYLCVSVYSVGIFSIVFLWVALGLSSTQSLFSTGPCLFKGSLKWPYLLKLLFSWEFICIVGFSCVGWWFSLCNRHFFCLIVLAGGVWHEIHCP